MSTFIDNLGLWLTILGLIAIVGYSTLKTPVREGVWQNGPSAVKEEVQKVHVLLQSVTDELYAFYQGGR